MGADLLPFLVNDQLDVEALRKAMQDMSSVQVEPGVLPATQKQAEQLGEDVPEGEDDVLAAEWFTEQRLHPEQHPVAAAAGSSLVAPVSPWQQDAQDDANKQAGPPSSVAASGGAAGQTAGVAAAAAEGAAAAEQTAATTAAGQTAAAVDAAAGAAAAAGQTASLSHAPMAASALVGSGAAGLAPTPAAGANHTAAIKVRGHSQATLDVAAATGTGTAFLGKRSHASHRGATYAELVQPVHGNLEWEVFRRLLRDCTTRKGINWQRMGDLWDEEMEADPSLTPKSTTILKAAERTYSDYLALKHSVCAMQEAAAPTGGGGSSAAAAAAVGSSIAAMLGATTMAVGAGVLPFVQAAQGAGMGQPVLVPLALQQLAQANMAAAAMPRPGVVPQLAMLGANSINPQMLAAAGLARPATNQAAALLLQQQQLQQALVQQQLRQQQQQQLLAQSRQQQLQQQLQQQQQPGMGGS